MTEQNGRRSLYFESSRDLDIPLQIGAAVAQNGRTISGTENKELHRYSSQ